MHVDKLILRRKKLNRFKKYWVKLRERSKQISLDDTKMQKIISIAEGIPKKPIVAPFVSAEENIIKYCINSLTNTDNQNESNFKILQDVEENLNNNIVEQDPMKQIAEIRQMIQAQDFQKLLYIAQQDLVKLSQKNNQELKELYESVKYKFIKAEQCPINVPEYRDNQIYKPEEIWRYGQDFIGYVDPAFIQDMVQNKEWYAEHSNQFLLNINYPCKLQTDFLKELELAQQRRNDLRYRKILENMDQIDHIKCQGKDLGQDYIMNSQQIVQISDEQRRKDLEASIRQMSLKQRTLIAQDDACCAICGVGDYEDDNQIVFCVQCSIPVHQQCFGLEAIPEIDWICYNCITFGFQRGLMVKCLLCPKRGGAMKPTNIFRSYEKYYEQKIKNLSKKTSKTNLGKLNVLTKENQNLILSKQLSSQWAQVESVDLEDAIPSETQDALEFFNSRVSKECHKFKSEVLQRLENNCCLSELIQREVNYKEKVQQEYSLKINEWVSNGSKLEELDLNESEKILKKQDEFELSFTKHELSNHCIPEDYSHFVQRNESKLEGDDAPQSDSLYHWVHHSCSMWTQGPQVTPKTPVRMNRLDFLKFGIGCVICGQKGPNVGAAVKCYKNECQIYFHVECAKRANYCMEIDKKSCTNNNLNYAIKVCQKDKLFKIYCESHRPFKIIQEINEQNIAIIEDIQKFTKTIYKCLEISQKHQIKPKKLISKSDRNKMLRQALILRKHELIAERKEAKLNAKPKKDKQLEQRQKKWKEKDKKQLLERVKEKYLQIRKMRFNILRINPIFQESTIQDREQKRIQKFNEKKKKKQLQNQQNKFFEDLIEQRQNRISEQVQRQQINEVQTLDDIFEGGDCSLQNHEENIEMNDSFNQEDQDFEELSNHLDYQEGTLSTFYKFSSPVQELEWTVTLSRYDFPWREIAFEPYTARDCYKKYTELVQDVQSFLTRVLGNKMKYQRMIQNQLMGQPTIDTLINMENIFQLQILQKTKQDDAGYHLQQKTTNLFNKKGGHNAGFCSNNNFYNGVPQANQDIFEVTSGRKKIIKGKRGKKIGSYNFENQIMIDTDKKPLDSNQQLETNVSYLGLFHQSIYQLGQQNHAPQYCKCKGLVPSSFMVACENGEDKCPNGGWLHPQCTEDLNLMSEEQINQIDFWYCQDCKAQTNLQKSGQDDRESSSEWNSLSSPQLFQNKTIKNYNKGEQSSNQEIKDQLQADEDLIFPNTRTNLSSSNLFQPQFQNLNKIVFQIDRSPQKHKQARKNEKFAKQGRQRLEKDDFLKDKVLEKKKQKHLTRKSSQIVDFNSFEEKENQNIIELNPLESSENKSQKSQAQIDSQILVHEDKNNIFSQLAKPEVENTWASSLITTQAKDLSPDHLVPDLIGQQKAISNRNITDQLHDTPALVKFLKQNGLRQDNNQINNQDPTIEERLILQQLKQILSDETAQNLIKTDAPSNTAPDILKLIEIIKQQVWAPEFQQDKPYIEDKSSLRQEEPLEIANLINQLQCIASSTTQDNRFMQFNPQMRFQQENSRYGQQIDLFSQVQNLVQERVPAFQEILRTQQQNEQVQLLQLLQMQLLSPQQQNAQQGQIVRNSQDSEIANLFQTFFNLQELIKVGAQVNQNEQRAHSQVSSQAGGIQVTQSQGNRGGQQNFNKQIGINQQILQEKELELTDEQIEMILSQLSLKLESQK